MILFMLNAMGWFKKSLVALGLVSVLSSEADAVNIVQLSTDVIDIYKKQGGRLTEENKKKIRSLATQLLKMDPKSSIVYTPKGMVKGMNSLRGFYIDITNTPFTDPVRASTWRNILESIKELEEAEVQLGVVLYNEREMTKKKIREMFVIADRYNKDRGVNVNDMPDIKPLMLKLQVFLKDRRLFTSFS